MVHIGLKEHAKAAELLTLAVSAPAQVCSLDCWREGAYPAEQTPRAPTRTLSPAKAINAIAVAAYKKLVLVTLISKARCAALAPRRSFYMSVCKSAPSCPMPPLQGTVVTLPKYTSSIVLRHLKTAAPEYIELANAFARCGGLQTHTLRTRVSTT